MQDELCIYDPRSRDPPNPVLCFQTRSGLTENIHRGVICCMEASSDADVRIVYQAGNIEQLFFPRSAVKYVQVLPLLESGCVEHFGFTEDEIAIMCASHEGLPIHLNTVRNILAKAGLNESDLNCGGHTPGCEESAFQYVRAGAPTPFTDHIYNNCSGKHAGFLALCQFKGFPIKGYLDPTHPVQVLIREAVSDIFCIPLEELRMGTDGCSAPAPIMSVRNAALGFARLCNLSLHQNPVRRNAIAAMISAITKHPIMVYAEGGFDTVLMEKFSGQVIGKRGAAGVFISGIVERGIGCAVKIDDGMMQPQYNVTMQILHWIYSGAKPIYGDSADADATSTEHTDTVSLLPGLVACSEECSLALQKLKEMDMFLSSPSVNSMLIRVGAMNTVPLRFTPS